jgi:hypothetical protein
MTRSAALLTTAERRTFASATTLAMGTEIFGNLPGGDALRREQAREVTP